MKNKNFRDYLKRDGLKLGTSVFEFDSPGIGYLLKESGAEYAFIDMEHSGFGIEALKRMMRYFEAAELFAFVRPPSKEVHHIDRVLDIGANGLMLPMVSSADEARQICNAMKYAPVGSRGVALNIAHDHYSSGSVLEKLNRANQTTAFIALIETFEGIENIDEIATLSELDALWVGHFDLSCSLGIPGEFEHPDFIDAMTKVVKAAKNNNKPLGRLVGSPDEGGQLYQQGFDIICYSGDLWLLQAALNQGLAAIREKCP